MKIIKNHHYQGAHKMKIVKVKNIFTKDGYTHINLEDDENYKMIYRAAKGVYWDSETSSLFYKGEVLQEDAIRFISEAMENEYYTTIILND